MYVLYHCSYTANTTNSASIKEPTGGLTLVHIWYGLCLMIWCVNRSQMSKVKYVYINGEHVCSYLCSILLTPCSSSFGIFTSTRSLQPLLNWRRTIHSQTWSSIIYKSEFLTVFFNFRHSNSHWAVHALEPTPWLKRDPTRCFVNW